MVRDRLARGRHLDGWAVFNSASVGAGVAVTVAVDGFDVTAGPVGGVPDAVAVSTTEPASMSACVTVYGPYTSWTPAAPTSSPDT